MDKGEISGSGGINFDMVESEVPVSPLTHEDKSCEGRLPFTLNVPMRTLWGGSKPIERRY
jgi:hypothetical protein